MTTFSHIDDLLAINETEARNAALLAVPGTQACMSDIDSAVLRMMENGADAETLKEWLLHTVDIFDQATYSDSVNRPAGNCVDEGNLRL